MRVVVAEHGGAAARVAADIVERCVAGTRPARLGLATGGTMQALFAELVARHRGQELSFAHVEVYLLDEYIGLDPCDPCAFRSVAHDQLARSLDLPLGALHGPNPHADDLDAECDRYEHEVRAASIGLQLLGIGSNGHIAFNEPGSAPDSTTRVVALSERTRADNAGFFPAGRTVPVAAITQGVGTILAAAEILLIACGAHKAEAVARALEGPVTPSVPASALRLHSRVTVVLDPPAASRLSAAIPGARWRPDSVATHSKPSSSATC